MTKILVATAAVIVILGGMMAAKMIVAPLILSIFFAVILIPPLRWLKKKGCSDTTALLLLSAILLLCGLGMTAVVGSSLSRFKDRLPAYGKKLSANLAIVETRVHGLLESLEAETTGLLGEMKDRPSHHPEISTQPDATSETSSEVTISEKSVSASSLESSVPIEPSAITEPSGNLNGHQGQLPINGVSNGPHFSMKNLIDTATLTELAKTLTSELISLLSVMLIVMVTVIFMLLEAARFPEKIEAAFGSGHHTNEQLEEIATSIWNYTVIKGWISLATGVATWIFLWAIGVEYALLWGILAFFFNFIPNVGPIIASVPPILLAWLDLGLGSALLATGGLVVINFAIGYGVEPKYLGDGLGISGLVVLLSLIFWGWLLGPVGMFLSAPLTMIVKIVLQAYDNTRWLAILLGPAAPSREKLPPSPPSPGTGG